MQLARLALGSLAGLLLGAVALAMLATPASATTITGDWVVSSSDFRVDDTITVVSTNASNGNVIIQPGADLHLENITLSMPFNRTLDNQGYLEVRNSSLIGPNWFFYLRGAADLNNVNIVNASHDTGGGLSGTYVVNNSVSFTGVHWSRVFPNTRDWFIHIRVVMDFKGNSLGSRGQLRYELAPITRALTIEIANNQFTMGSMMTATTAIDLANVLHTGAVTYDMHDNAFENGDDAIAFGSSSASTTYLIHDSTFSGTASTAIEVGQGTSADRFGGALRIWNVSISGANRAVRVYGIAGSGITSYLDNVSVSMCANGIVANEASLVITNSTIASTDPQYQGESNGHLLVYTTADTALNGAATAAGASIEHFSFLNVRGASWQNSVAIVGSVVLLRTAGGAVNLQIDPPNWSARGIVWWGRYNGAPDVDNRDLRPEVDDGPRVFSCAPSQFFVSDSMAPISIVCTDDAAPTASFVKPPVNWLQNWSALFANGSGTEYGSGLGSFEWSFDNASWGPVTLAPGLPINWSVTTSALSDGVYTLYLRATDRVGLVGYASRGPVTIDLTAPTLVLPLLPTYASGIFLNLSGATEPFANVSVRTAGGFTSLNATGANGSFTLWQIPLTEGQNLLWITAVDRAGNTYTLQAMITVDSVPPSLVVFENATELTGDAVWTVSGLSESTAVVRVNSIIASRNGAQFTTTLSLLPSLNPITVTATDLAGNQATWFGAVWSDPDPPSLDVSVNTGNTTAEGVPVTRAAAVPVTGTATDAITRVVLLTINGANYSIDGAGAFFVSLPVVDGDNTVVVSATDVAGNVRTRTLHVLRDSTAPTVQVSLEGADAPLLVVENFVYTTGAFVNVWLEMSEDGVATVRGETRAVTLGLNGFNVSLTEGLNSVPISTRDRAGNLGAPHTVSVTRDTTPPSLTVSSPAPGASIDGTFVVVQGVTEPGANVTVNGQRAAVGASGAFTAQVDVAAGTSTLITVVASDPLGNANATSLTVTRRSQAVATGDTGSLTGVLFLAIGAGVGVALGFFIRGRPREAADSWAPSGQAPSSPSAPPTADARADRGAKGPRGPHPPGG